MFSVRQLQVAVKTTCLQRLGHTYSTETQIHPVRVRTFASTPRIEATGNPSFQDSPLFQQLANNPNALFALKEFGQFLKEQGLLPTLIEVTHSHRYFHTLSNADQFIEIDFSPERPPSTLQLFRLMANPAFRNGVQKLREDLANAGVNVDPENAMEMLNAFKGQDTKSEK